MESKKATNPQTVLEEPVVNVNSFVLPSKMCRKNYGPVNISSDLSVNNVIENVTRSMDSKLMKTEK